MNIEALKIEESFSFSLRFQAKDGNEMLKLIDYVVELLEGYIGILDNVIENMMSNLDAIEFELRENIKTNEKVKELKLRRNYVK